MNLREELNQEIARDMAFIEKVSERIYSENDDWEDSIAEPEWILDMTDIADKYLMRFNTARAISENQAKKISIDLETMKDVKELLENALYQQLSSAEVEGQTQEALDTIIELLGR